MRPSDTSSVSILCVDDEPDFVDMTGTFLEQEDDRITIETATSASEGLDHLAENEVDCIVSDYNMPGMDGIEFLETVRDEHPELPFILFTGKGSEKVASDAIAEGATDYLQKQPGREQYELLANRITNAVDQYRATQRAANLERIRRVIRDANQALVRAETRDELEQHICEIISDADPYCFAWIGEVDPDAQTVEPRTAAGIEDGYLDTIEITTDERPAGQGPTGRAVRSRELVAVQNIPENAEYKPWREDALERGYRSSAAIPLVQDDTLYGILNVYADRIDAFDEEERELLTELADDIAHARDRLEGRARQEHLERIVDSLPVGVYRATSEPDGGVVDANLALADMFDADSTDALVGRQISDYYQDPEKRGTVSDQLLQEGLIQGKELRLETLEGDDIWIELTAIRTEKGDEVQFGGIIEDITERKEPEKDLERYETIVEATGDPVYTLDEDGYITYVNQAVLDLSGYDEDELFGAHATKIMSEEHYDRGTELIQSLLHSEQDRGTFEMDFVTDDSEHRPSEIHVALLPYEDEFRGTVGVIRDISNRIKREQRLERERDRLDAFAGIVSHDLRNPLNVAQGRLELAAEDCDSDDLMAVENSLDRMETLIDDLLALAKAGEALGETEPVELAELIYDCWQSVETEAAELVADTNQVIEADQSRLRQLLENLFRNAIEHGGDSVTITVGDLSDGFYVEDDGLGIPEADWERVFETGYTTDVEGTGLGLSIVKEIVTAHGWRIRITDRGDEGARFEITGAETGDI